MREIRPSGSEGGVVLTTPLLPPLPTELLRLRGWPARIRPTPPTHPGPHLADTRLPIASI